MNLLSRFKKDYLNYLVSIILPALIGGASVPIFKHFLGAEGYGTFAIYLNAGFLCTAITTGWISQSIFRFYPAVDNKFRFARISLFLSAKTQFFLFVPIIIFFWINEHSILLGITVCAAIFLNSMQMIYVALAQSSFLSKKNISSEFIRSASYITVSVSFLFFFPKNYLLILFSALGISYLLSAIYLRKQTLSILKESREKIDREITPKKIASKFFSYGAPLSLWLIFAFLIPYIDKIWMKYNLGGESQGNYQAIFDLLSKGLTLIISPITISLLPLLTHAFTNKEHAQIRSLMKRIILLEIGGFIIAAILYWWFGYYLIFKLLHIPNTLPYKYMGLIVLAGTFIWQIGIVIQQKYVLKMMTRFLLIMVMVTVIFQSLFYWVFNSSSNPLIYSLGFLFASTLYLILVSFPFIKNQFLYRKEIEVNGFDSPENNSKQNP